MTSFEVTWDYRCPFARIAHEHILTGLEAGADWEVTFRAFSLDQTHVDEGRPPVWDEPEKYPGLLANLAGIVVRDRMPEQFHGVHRALFAARHEHSLDLRDRQVVSKALADAGVDSEAVLAEVDAGGPLQTLAAEHSDAASRLHVFGVPTFIIGSGAVFVRLMTGPGGDGQLAVSTVSRVLDLLTGWPELNEFKHTSLSN
jgi:hypothetical protein